MGEFEVDEAMVEIQDEPKHMIERKTAKRWAARSIASFIIASKSDEPNQIFKRYIEGDDYRHEAIEHASLAEDDGILVGLIERACDRARDKVDLSPLGVTQMEKCELRKSPYGPKGMGLYVDADNARRKMTRSSTGANKPTISQQASAQAAKDKARSRKNPVKIYKPHEIHALFRNGFKPLKVA